MKPTRRIALLLSLVFVLPALLFSGYEISSLTRDEVMIQQVYEKQLEAILFSINQYSDDVINSWISKIDNGLTVVNDESTDKIQYLLALNSSLRTIFVSDTINNNVEYRFFTLVDSSKSLRPKIDQTLSASHSKIQQLIAYKKSGFQKIESIPYAGSETENLKCLVFIMGDHAGELQPSGLLIDPETFIQEVVGPRLQVIAKDQFILSVTKKGSTTPTYSTLSTDTATFISGALTKEFWLFPDYSLGIRTKGSSLQKVIEQRTNTNLALVLLLDAVLIVAVVLVFRNVKKEVHLAQNKSDFVSNVSHEIRTPLALISMFAETLEMGRATSEEKKKEYYSIISKEAHRLSGIVNKILNFSQTEANKKKLTSASIDVTEELKGILNTYDFHLKNKGFEYTFTEKVRIWVNFDKEAFAEVVINLIDNAVKYSAEKKLIEISTGMENDQGYVAVKDHGVGISPMDQKHIFDKFYRVSSGNLAKSLGTGLGLSLVKQLMEVQQGSVKVSSALGKGSLFKLYFPLDRYKSE